MNDSSRTLTKRAFNFKDLTGQKFGRLTAVRMCGKNKDNTCLWVCVCECGAEVIINRRSLTTRNTKSCGCLKTTHGMTKSSEHNIWTDMKQRCFNRNNKDFKNYGGRGIGVCKRWIKFENFLSDMGKRPDGKTLDRINNDGDYSPENCRWSTVEEQCNNKRVNIVIEYGGKRHTITEWSRIVKMNPTTLFHRVRSGWSAGSALTSPVKKYKLRT